MPRPLSITIVSGFLFFAAAAAVVVGFSVLLPNPLLDRLWELNKPGAVFVHSVGGAFGLFLFVLSGATLAAAFGLLRGRAWAWWFAVVLFTVDTTGDVLSYLIIHDLRRTVLGTMVSILLLILLLRPKARDYFFRQALTPNHSP